MPYDDDSFVSTLPESIRPAVRAALHAARADERDRCIAEVGLVFDALQTALESRELYEVKP